MFGRARSLSCKAPCSSIEHGTRGLVHETNATKKPALRGRLCHKFKKLTTGVSWLCYLQLKISKFQIIRQFELICRRHHQWWYQAENCVDKLAWNLRENRTSGPGVLHTVALNAALKIAEVITRSSDTFSNKLAATTVQHSYLSLLSATAHRDTCDKVRQLTMFSGNRG